LQKRLTQPMKILKFGNSTLIDSHSIEKVIAYILSESNKGNSLAVVVSAMDKVADNLVKISQLAMVGNNSYKPLLQEIEDSHFAVVKYFIDVKRQAKVIAGLKVMLNDLEEILYGVYLLWELSPRTFDHINTYGVKLMAYLLAECLKEQNLDANYLDAQKIIVTNDNYGFAQVDLEATSDKIIDFFTDNHQIQVVTGYIGATAKGESTTLGRSGSVLTASLLASSLKTEVIEIFTDRNGIINTDPSLVENAFSLPSITYAEAMEMSHFDNKFIYPPTIQPALSRQIPMLIKNLFNTGFAGTWITAQPMHTNLKVKANSSIQHVSLINVQGSGMIGVAGVAARVFNALATNQISVVLITQASSEHSICLAVRPNEGTKAQIALQNEFIEEIKEKKLDNISLSKDLSILAIIGENMKKTPGIAGKIFTSLGENKINVIAIAQGSSELNISIVIENKDLSKALNVLQSVFF
jgi:bifunctional aspartokinase / homoserine dehydrogenase 1